MKTTRSIHAAVLFASVALAGCGGGGSGNSGPSSSSSSSSSSSGGTAPPPAITFRNQSVHDPSVIKVGTEYYVFGSHLAAAKTTDLMNWTMVADGVDNANPLFTNVLTALQQTFAWSQVNDLWAPDVVKLADNHFHFYYDSCRGDSPLSALGVAVSDSVTGPYTNKQIILRSGMAGLSDDGVTNYDAKVHPNVVDPNTFFDATGNLWMVYGSYSGGIFILSMDEITGLPEPGQGYGTHLMGGNHARIEGAYVLYNAQTGFYYLFTSFGGLAADGAYNIRVARSQAADGPYFDAAGTNMDSVRGNPAVPFDDTRIAPHGQKLVGNFQFALATGESGIAEGYVSPGHNSTYYDAGLDKYFIIFHTRFPGRGEQHEIRVHQLMFNSQGWPVMAPFRYAPLSASPAAVVAEVTNADVPGAYKVIDHGKDMLATIKPSQTLRLNADGTMAGALTGTWLHRGSNLVDLSLGGVIYNGVLSRQWNTNANRFVVTFSAQAPAGNSIWGARTGD